MAKETCIDCNYCVSQDSKKGIFFKCLKQKTKIDNPFLLCRNDKNKKVLKYIDKYMRLYKNKTAKEIALAFGWKYQRLYSFAMANCLPFIPEKEFMEERKNV